MSSPSESSESTSPSSSGILSWLSSTTIFSPWEFPLSNAGGQFGDGGSIISASDDCTVSDPGASLSTSLICARTESLESEGTKSDATVKAFTGSAWLVRELLWLMVLRAGTATSESLPESRRKAALASMSSPFWRFFGCEAESNGGSSAFGR